MHGSRLGVLAAAILTLGSAVAAQTGPGERAAEAPVPIANVVWRTPVGAALKGVFPAEALELGMAGSASARCLAGPDGRLSRCQVVDELPRGMGFGAALLKAAPSFQASAETFDGASVYGREVWFGMAFGFTEPTMVCSAARLAAEGRPTDLAAHRAAVAKHLAERPLHDEAEVRRTLERQSAVLTRVRSERPQAFARLGAACAEFEAPSRWTAPAPSLLLRAAPDGALTLRVPARRVASPPAALVGEFYPRKARQNEVEGRARAQCRLGLDGLLRHCRLISEEPAGYGFGPALLQLAGSFRFSPTRDDGRPVEDTATIPMRFVLAD